MIDLIYRYVLPAAYAVLPPQMSLPAADAMLLAIGLQESRFTHRRQLQGPARGFWQFEVTGVAGVMGHLATREPLRAALHALQYDPALSAPAYQAALEHNDILAAVFARLLLWTSPFRLSDLDHAGEAWSLYLDLWRPGKPHDATWRAFYSDAWVLVTRPSPGVGLRV